MFYDKTTSLVAKLTELNDSTTFFLEMLRGSPLRISMRSQDLKLLNGVSTIRREVKLFFESSDQPVLYCISYLNTSKLTPDEYALIIDGSRPIGRIFCYLNSSDSIVKKNICVTNEISPTVAKILNVSSLIAYKKGYEYWVGERNVGYVSEYFNEESLNRV